MCILFFKTICVLRAFIYHKNKEYFYLREDFFYKDLLVFEALVILNSIAPTVGNYYQNMKRTSFVIPRVTDTKENANNFLMCEILEH